MRDKQLEKILSEYYWDILLTPSPERDYFLGLWCADGSYIVSRKAIKMSLQLIDAHILEKCRKFILPELEYFTTDHCTMISYRLDIFSEILRKLGIFYFEQKMKTSSRIKHVKKINIDKLERNLKYQNLFIRGFIDGDGSISSSISIQQDIERDNIISWISDKLNFNNIRNKISAADQIGKVGHKKYLSKKDQLIISVSSIDQSQFPLKQRYKERKNAALLYKYLYPDGYTNLCLKRKHDALYSLAFE